MSAGEHQVTGSRRIYDGRVLGLRVDTVRMSDGSLADREIVDHPGAVGIVALYDADSGPTAEGPRVVLVSQYRAAIGRRTEELPAGLLDVAGEPALAAAQRELAEEAGLAAGRWDVLLDLNPSPGMSDEAIRIFLARDLRAHRPDGFAPEAEELTLTTRTVALDEAVRVALAGELTNAAAVAGVLAAAAVARADWRGLRPADAPWPDRPAAGGARP